MEDEFDIYDFSEFTQEDFAQIDAAAAAAVEIAPPILGGSSAGPRTTIEIEEDADASVNKGPLYPTPSSSKSGSPFKRFRSWNQVLSVSDLVGPAWCELQFDYGLRQKRYKKLEDRPTSFVTDTGKVISVNKEVAKDNDKTLKRGQSVHKALEREIRPEEVKVDITTPEERWGLRLVNMISSVQSLMDGGCCREMPVFGLIHDQIVVGIIDELNRRPAKPAEKPHLAPEGASRRTSDSSKRSCPSTPSKSSNKRIYRLPSPPQPSIESFFIQSSLSTARDLESLSALHASTSTSQVPSQNPETTSALFSPRSAQFTLHISDTKTRRTPSLPPEEDTLGTRLQLMLYHRLLSSLLATASDIRERERPTALNFDALWARLGLNPSKPFSKSFLEQAGLLVNNSSSLNCLDSLTAAWRHTAQALHVDGADPILTLVYRLQPSTVRRTKKKKRKTQEAGAPESTINAPSDDDLYPGLQEALNASLLASSKMNASQEAADLARAQYESMKSYVTRETVSLNTELDLGSTSGVSMIPHTPNPCPSVSTSLLTIRTSTSFESLTDAPSPPDSIEVQDSQDTTEYMTASSSVSQDMDMAAPSPDYVATPPNEPESQLSQGSQGSAAYMTAPESLSPIISDDEDSEVSEVALPDVQVLGTKEFVMDDALLDGHLASVLQWWYGLRPPRGVEVEKARRCDYCEYKNDCEWREQKAREATTKKQFT